MLKKPDTPLTSFVALSVKKEVAIGTNTQVKQCQIQFNTSQKIQLP